MTTVIDHAIEPSLGQLLAESLAAARAWMRQGACVGLDVEMFFPEKSESTLPAKAVCRGCEVRVECLEHALAHGEKHGIWGGLSERERKRVRRARRHARAGTAAR